MQFSREETEGHLILAVEPGRIRIGEHWLTSHLIVSAETLVSDWMPRDTDRVTIDDLEPALALTPELVIVGTGNRPVSPDIDLMSELAARAIGLETMQTAAACRTYNVLVHEGRRVAAALIVDS